MKSIIIIILFIFYFVGFSQTTTPKSPLLKKENYIPYPNTPNDFIKTIHVAIHIWQRADGSGNLQDTPRTKARMEKIVMEWINHLYEKNFEPAFPALSYPADTLYDSRIRFKLEGIYFYRDATKDSSYYYSTRYLHNKKLNDYVIQHFPERAKTLNLHLFRGSYVKASGYSEAGSIGSFYRTNPDMDENDVHDFWFSKHWAHEIGHGLDLWHTYDANPTYQQNCNLKYTDFLWDVYDTTIVDSKSKGCPYPLITDKNNNNLMGGSSGTFMSILQMGIAHRAMVLENQFNKGYNMRDFVTGYGYWALNVTTDTHWDLSMKLYQDVVVKSGATLRITNTIQMVPQAKIVIEKGATLILDGGTITNEKYYNKKWKGIKIQKAGKKSAVPSGKLEILNGGKVLFGKIK